MQPVEQVLERLGPPDRGPRILGIDGPAGAGKSTLAARVAAATGSPVIGIDDFVGWTDLDPAGTSWWPRLEAEVLEPFLAGRPIAYRRRDWYGDPDGLGLLPEPVRFDPSPLLVLEGVSVTRRALAARLALRVWVDAPEDIRLARGLDRDGEHQLDHWLRWQALETEFFLEDGTRDRADLVLVTA